MILTLFYISLCFFVSFCQDITSLQDTSDKLREFLQFLAEYEREASNICYRTKESQWIYSTNVTRNNKMRMIDDQVLQSKFQRSTYRKAAGFPWTQLQNPVLSRQLQLITRRDYSALPDSKFDELKQLIQDMKEIYTKTKVCPYYEKLSSYCNHSLEPELSRTLAHSRDYEEQLHVWKSWHDAIGPQVRDKYIRYIELTNQAARLNGFRDASHQQQAQYEDPNFALHMAEVWSQLTPLYRQLHAYVRKKLHDYYGPRRVQPDGPIPAHILGNMWAQSWKNILDLVIPFPGKRRVDVTQEMLRQHYKPLRMFQAAEEFFTSLGMKPMPVEFWRKSMLEAPSDHVVACKASAWDFCNQRDYRIKQCTEVNMDDLLTTHHEVTHVQYYLQYADQPLIFRDGANPAFHEALSEAVCLSVVTPRHMHRIGLLNNITDDYETDINFLLEMALDKVAYLPFAYLVDQWRWSVQAEGTNEMNSRWWALRLRHQGIYSPVRREETHFDPAAKYHIVADQPYIRYFVALVLQFQMHEALCQASGHRGMLHTCDIYRSREAGRLLSKIMSAGLSKPWSEVIKIATLGKTSQLDPRPLIEYFTPLMLWLQYQNRDERHVGWSSTSENTALFGQWFHTSASYTTSACPMLTTLIVQICLAVFSLNFHSI